MAFHDKDEYSSPLRSISSSLQSHQTGDTATIDTQAELLSLMATNMKRLAPTVEQDSQIALSSHEPEAPIRRESIFSEDHADRLHPRYPSIYSPSSSSTEESRPQTYTRKDKSLGELCKRFLSLYGRKSTYMIALDECTQSLGVERRRIYDIINILESLNVLIRKAKNLYEWRGIS